MLSQFTIKVSTLQVERCFRRSPKQPRKWCRGHRTWRRSRSLLRHGKAGQRADQPASGAGRHRTSRGRSAGGAVDQQVPGGVDVFQERAIEMNATAEDAVVSKTARVTEELVVGKTSDSRVETISDTVRKTEVAVDQLGSGERAYAPPRVRPRRDRSPRAPSPTRPRALVRRPWATSSRAWAD